MEPIASQIEILEALSRIVRAEATEKNTSSICRAAELIGKYYGLFDGTGNAFADESPVIIYDDL